MLYARFDEDGERGVEDVLLPAFGEYLEAYVASVDACAVDAGAADAARDRQADYDSFNAARDPAHGLFTSYFGAEWADDYVHDFLFALSEAGAEGT